MKSRIPKYIVNELYEYGNHMAKADEHLGEFKKWLEKVGFDYNLVGLPLVDLLHDCIGDIETQSYHNQELESTVEKINNIIKSFKEE